MVLHDRYMSTQENVKFWKPLSQVWSTKNPPQFMYFWSMSLGRRACYGRQFYCVLCSDLLNGKVLSAIFWVHSCICHRIDLAGDARVTPNISAEQSLLNCLKKGDSRCCSDVTGGGLPWVYHATEYIGSSGVWKVY